MISKDQGLMLTVTQTQRSLRSVEDELVEFLAQSPTGSITLDSAHATELIGLLCRADSMLLEQDRMMNHYIKLINEMNRIANES